MNIYREAYLHLKNFPIAFWVVIFATLMNQLGNMGLVFLVPYATQHLGFTLSQSAIAFAVVGGSMFVGGFIAGSLIDSLGAARVMISTVAMNGVVLLCFSAVHNYYAILVMCVVWGLTYGGYRPASQTFVSYLTVEGMHKITFSVYRLAINLGMSIGPAVGGYIVAHSFPAIYIINGTANILAGIILIVGLGSVWMMHRPVSDQTKILSLKFLKNDAALRIFLLGMLPVIMVFFQHESTLPVYIKENLKLPLSLYGWLFTVNTLMIVFLELPLNIATINWSYRLNFILGTLLITVGFACFSIVSSVWQVILLTMIWTLGEMLLFPSASSYIAEIAPAGRRGSYMSLFSSNSNLALMIGPWAGAVVMQHLGGSMLWVMCGVWGMLSVAVFVYLRK